MFDFTKTFDFIGKAFVRALALNVRQQRGIDGQGYSHVKPATAKKRGIKMFRNKSETINPRTGRAKTFTAPGMSLKRLFVTGEFSSGGFRHTPEKDGVDVFVPESDHKGNITMANIMRYNSRGQARVNPYIVTPPLVFPNTAGEVALIRDANSGASILERGQKMLKDEIVRQMREQGILVAKKELHIG